MTKHTTRPVAPSPILPAAQDQPDAAQPVGGRSAAALTDTLALAFAGACGVLAAPLLFASGLPRPLLSLIVVLLAAVFAARALRSRRLLPSTPVNWPQVLLLLLLPVGLWATSDKATSWPVVFKVIAGFAVFYGVASLAGTRWLRALPWLLMASSLVVGIIVLLGADWFQAKLPWIPDGVYRALPSLRLPWRPQGINPNLAGSTVAWLIMPAAALALWACDKRLRALALATALLLGVTLLLSQSRGAWLGVAVALPLLPLRYRRGRQAVAVAALVLAVLAVMLGPARLLSWVLPGAAGEETALNTLPGRLELWQRAWFMLRDFGLAGIGPGQFEPLVMTLYPPFYTRVLGGFQHAHNLYLQAALDFGMAGLIGWLALLLGSIAGLLRVVRARIAPFPAPERDLLPLAWGVLGSIVVLMVHGLVEAPQVAPRGYAMIFALLGAGAALASHARSADDPPARAD